MKRPKDVPKGSQPVQLVGTGKSNKSGKDTILWVGPNHGKLGVLVLNPDGIKRLTVKGQFKRHEWVPVNTLLSTETATYKVCKRCGYVQNDLNKDKECKPRKNTKGIWGILRKHGNIKSDSR